MSSLRNWMAAAQQEPRTIKGTRTVYDPREGEYLRELEVERLRRHGDQDLTRPIQRADVTVAKP